MSTDLGAEIARSAAATRWAPEPLALVQVLVNTANRIRGWDVLDDRSTTRAWLEQIAPDAGEADPTDDDLASLRKLREALRGLLRPHTHGGAVAPDTLEALRRLTNARPLRVAVDDAGVPVLRPDTGHLDGPVAVVEARILAALPVAAVDGTLARLKVCANPDCEWAFYDTSRSRSGTWCVMNVCGARHKMSRYRSRQRESADGGDGVDL